jgi:hypothetical protein
MTYSDFLNWKQDPVTQAFYEAMEIRIEDAKETLAVSAGIDNATDNFNRGFIAAYAEATNFTVEDVE